MTCGLCAVTNILTADLQAMTETVLPIVSRCIAHQSTDAI